MFCSIAAIVLYVSTPEVPDFQIGFKTMSCNQLQDFIIFAEENVKKLDTSGISQYQILKNKSIFTYQLCYAKLTMKEKKCLN